MAYRRTYQLSRLLKVAERKKLAEVLFRSIGTKVHDYNQFLETISDIEANTEMTLIFPATRAELIERDFETALRDHPKHALALIFAVAYLKVFQGNAVEVCPNTGYVMCRYSDLDEEVADMENCVETIMAGVACEDKADPYFRFVYLLRITIGG